MNQELKDQNDSQDVKFNLKTLHLRDPLNNASVKDTSKDIKIYIPHESYDNNMSFEQNLAEGRVKLFSEMPANDFDNTVDPIQENPCEIQKQNSLDNQTGVMFQQDSNNFLPQKTSNFGKVDFPSTAKHVTYNNFTDSVHQNLPPKQHCCDVCYQSFDRRRDLALHYLLHSEKEKKRAAKTSKKCDICGKIPTMCNCKYIVKEIYPVCSNSVRVNNIPSSFSISQPVNASVVFIKTESNSGDSSVIKRELYSCPDCEQTFGLESQLKQHALVHKRERAKREIKRYFYCNFCSKKFEDNSSLMFHVTTIHPDTLPSVGDSPYCNQNDSNELNRELYACPECKKTFGLESELKQHALVHKRERSKREIKRYFYCNFCSHKFEDNSSLMFHVSTTHPDSIPSVSNSQNNARNDSFITRDTKNTCSEYEKTFEVESQLKQHTLEHNVECSNREENISFYCNLCSNKFNDDRSLIFHVATVHPDSLPSVSNSQNDTQNNSSFITRELYTCSENGKTVEESQLKQHTVECSNRNENMSFYCNLCSKTFRDSSTLLIHVTDAHPYSIQPKSNAQNCTQNNVGHESAFNDFEPQICSACHSVFHNKDGLRKHLKRLGWVCDICNTYFCRKSDFNEHYLTHIKHKYSNIREHLSLTSVNCASTDVKSDESQLYSCKICNKNCKYSFLLKHHERSHKKIITHSCYLCKRKYMQKRNLYIHYFSHSKHKNICEVCNKQFFSKRCLQLHYKTHLLSIKKET